VGEIIFLHVTDGMYVLWFRVLSLAIIS